MAILLKNAETEKKIRKLARRTGVSLTTAVDHAVDARLSALAPTRRKRGKVDRKKIAELLAYFDSLPKMNEHLTDDEIIGYDENGLPT